MDIDFKKFLTPLLIKIIWVLGIVFNGLAGLGALISGVLQGEWGMAAVGILILLFGVLLLRIWLELIMVVFKIAENTAHLRPSQVIYQQPTIADDEFRQRVRAEVNRMGGYEEEGATT